MRAPIEVGGTPATLAIECRRDRCRHRHGASALPARAGDDGGGKRVARRSRACSAASIRASSADRVRRIGAETGLALDPQARVADLPVGAQQRLEIVKALARDARILILDEPTAVLSPAESRELYSWLRSFVARGRTVVLITHKVREALAVADAVTVLRRGRTVLSGCIGRTRRIDGGRGDDRHEASAARNTCRRPLRHPARGTRDVVFARTRVGDGRTRRAAAPRRVDGSSRRRDRRRRGRRRIGPARAASRARRPARAGATEPCEFPRGSASCRRTVCAMR